MNRITAMLLALGMMACLAACGGQTNPAPAIQADSAPAAAAEQSAPASDAAAAAEQTPVPETAAEPIPSPAAEMAQPEESAVTSDILVVYFSRTGEQYRVGVIDKGNTAIVAEMIAEAAGADSFEILPAEDYYPYTYDELTDVAKREQNDDARPAIAGEIPDFDQYSTVFIGAPVWWGDWPMIMYTFFERYDFSGKTLIPFSTHQGSGLSGFDRSLAAACPNSAVLEGLAIAGTDAQEEPETVRGQVNDWLAKLGYVA